jgi:hypothetical protein
MRTTWIITSAVHTGAGIYDSTARILQTHATVNSIAGFFPDARIILAEGGKRPEREDPMFDELRARCHAFVDARQSDDIRRLHANVFDRVDPTEGGGLSGIAKSLGEAALMAGVLDVLEREPSAAAMLDVDRVFKISGRYQLSPLFDPSAYRDAGDKYVFAKREPSWIEDAARMIGVDHYFNSRLWSFSPARMHEVSEGFRRMIREIQEIMAMNGAAYTNVEHLLFKHFRGQDAVELDHVHVMGTLAPSGVIVYD